METSGQSPSPDPVDPSASEPGSTQRRGRPLTTAVAVLIGVAAALVVVFALAGGDADNDAAIAGDTAFAEFAFLTTDGSTATLADFEGEPMVVNFFASWCAPCRAELPDFERVHADRKDEVTFLGINHDLDEATWRTFVAETEITFETVFQPDTEIFTAFEAKGMPSTAFVSPEGEVLHLHTGLLTDELLEELIDEHLGEA